MTPIMMEKTAAEAMRPVVEPIELGSTTAAARDRMREENRAFLPVVAPGTGKLLGVVLRTAVERACESNGHDPETCPLVHHLKVDIDFCFTEDTVAEVLEGEADFGTTASAHARKARIRRSLPVIVVDERKVPVGVLVR